MGCAIVQQADCMAAFMLMLLIASSSTIWDKSRSWACMHACNVYKLQQCTVLGSNKSAQQQVQHDFKALYCSRRQLSCITFLAKIEAGQIDAHAT